MSWPGIWMIPTARTSKFVNDDGTCTGAFSTAIGGCAKFKCMLGGWANPVCHACVGTGIVCLVAAIVHLADDEQPR